MGSTARALFVVGFVMVGLLTAGATQGIAATPPTVEESDMLHPTNAGSASTGKPVVFERTQSASKSTARATDADDPAELANVSGALTTSDPYNETFNGYYDTYSFEGEQGERISIEVRVDDASEHAAAVFLIGPDGNVVDGGFAGADAYGDAQLNRFSLPDTGTYTVIVTTDAGDNVYDSVTEGLEDTFSYQLRIHANDGIGATENVETGAQLNASITKSDNFLDSFDGYYDAYSFGGEQGERISIEVRVDDATAHAASVFLLGPDGNMVEGGFASPDNYGDAQLNRFTLPETGTYIVIITPYAPDSVYDSFSAGAHDTFAYQLRIYGNQGIGATQNVTLGNKLNASITGSDNFLDAFDGYYDAYSFEGEQGERVSIEARVSDATAHAASVFLLGPDGNMVEGGFASPDNYGDAQLNRFTLPETGTYTVIITPYAPDGVYDSFSAGAHDTFAYQLRIYGNQGIGATQNVTLGNKLNASITGSDNFLDAFDGYYDAYSFEGEQGERVSIEARIDDGSQHAASIFLLGPDGNMVEGGFASADVTGDAQLERFTLPETGTYTVIITPYAPDGVYDSVSAGAHDTFAYQLRIYGNAGIGTAQSVTLGTSLIGEREQSDNFLDSFNGYYDAYSFEGNEGETISTEVRLDSESQHAPAIFLVAPNGDVVQVATSSGGSVQLERYTLSATGTYTVIVSATSSSDVYDSSTAGEQDTFQYQFRLYGTQGVGNRGLIGYNASFTGDLSIGDNYLSELTGYFDAYALPVQRSDMASITVEVDAADRHAARLYLLGPDGTVVTTVGSDGGGTSIDSFTFDQTGVYTVIVSTDASSSVYGSREAAAEDTFEYALSVSGPANNPPLVSVNATPAPAAIGETVELSATVRDPNTDTISYSWEQVIGSVPDPEVSLVGATTATASFEAPEVSEREELTFAVTVSDGTATVERQVTVAIDPSLEPVIGPEANLTYSPTTPSPGETVRFDASESSDSDGTIASYEWDFDGDGQTDATGATVTHSFDTGGNYTVTLTVTDDAGNTDTVTRTVTVESPNTAPVAAFAYSPPTPTPGETILFNASSSSDTDGSIASYEWDFDGDGQTDATGATASHSFGATGNYTVTLTVTDGEGATATTTQTITVSAPTGPPALPHFDSPPTNVDADSQFEDVNGNGEFDIGDVQALFAQRDSNVVQNNVAAFDFNGNGDIDIGDIQSLFVEYVR